MSSQLRPQQRPSSARALREFLSETPIVSERVDVGLDSPAAIEGNRYEVRSICDGEPVGTLQEMVFASAV
jgi:hypothetical protein